MRVLTICLLALAAVALPAAAQSYVYVPDADATSGTCNFIPFGQSSSWTTETIIIRYPAATLDPANPVIADVAFAPCWTGTWSDDNVRIGIGHVPSVLPSPFNFPQPGGPIGDFLDYTELVNGPFCWSAHTDVWSELNLGSGFIWNGVNDIALFMTFANATVTGGNGACHRTGTEPYRMYDLSAMNAANSTGEGATGSKTRLECRPAVYVPDSDATTGTCNVFPWGQTNFTYVSRIPASSLSAANPVITDVSFAPCGTGIFAAPQVIVGLGHLPAVLPNPMNFPGGGTGDFLDFTVYHNGPLAWYGTANTWSPINLGSNFKWNGVNDVGIYVSILGASASWGGAAHRSSTVDRRFASSYGAPASTGGDTSALKMGVVTSNSPLAPKYRLCLQGFPDGSAFLGMTNIPTGTAFGFTFVSFTTFMPGASGPFFGIFPDSVVWSILGFIPSAGNPLAWTWPVPPITFPNAGLSIPPGGLTPFAGLTWDFVGVALDPIGNVLGATNAARVTW